MTSERVKIETFLLKEDLKDKKLYIEVAKTKYTAGLQPKSLNQKNFKSI